MKMSDLIRKTVKGVGRAAMAPEKGVAKIGAMMMGRGVAGMDKKPNAPATANADQVLEKLRAANKAKKMKSGLKNGLRKNYAPVKSKTR